MRGKAIFLFDIWFYIIKYYVMNNNGGYYEMKKILVILMISSISIILLSSCKKDKKEIHKSESNVMPVGVIKSFGEYYNKIKNMSPAKKAEYIQDFNGKKITWPVTIIDKDENEILKQRYPSASVVEFNDPAAPIGIMLCYTDDDITKIKQNQRVTISGTIIADRNMIDLFPCKIVK